MSKNSLNQSRISKKRNRKVRILIPRNYIRARKRRSEGEDRVVLKIIQVTKGKTKINSQEGEKEIVGVQKAASLFSELK